MIDAKASERFGAFLADLDDTEDDAVVTLKLDLQTLFALREHLSPYLLATWEHASEAEPSVRALHYLAWLLEEEVFGIPY
jgi:hypothetical protein